MVGSGHLISGADVATGAFVLMMFAAGAVMAVLAMLAVFMIRRTGRSGLTGALWGGGVVLAGAVLAFLLFDRSPSRDLTANRRAIEARASALTAQAIAPGSALACLDHLSNSAVEGACEKALFATPEAVAAGVTYVDARLSLLAPSAALAARDPSYRPVFERLRHGLEQDRFGFVAHALTTRGCNSPSCSDFALLQNPARILANMKAHAFAAHVSTHALAWHPGANGAGMVAAAAPSSALPPSMATGEVSAETPAHPPTPSSPSRYEFPSASSIPPISIMNPEPEAPAAPETKTTPAAKKPPTRRQTAREAAPSPPPTPIVPQAAQQPQTSGSR